MHGHPTTALYAQAVVANALMSKQTQNLERAPGLAVFASVLGLPHSSCAYRTQGTQRTNQVAPLAPRPWQPFLGRRPAAMSSSG
jgi:hypothetical protein